MAEATVAASGARAVVTVAVSGAGQTLIYRVHTKHSRNGKMRKIRKAGSIPVTINSLLTVVIDSHFAALDWHLIVVLTLITCWTSANNTIVYNTISLERRLKFSADDIRVLISNVGGLGTLTLGNRQTQNNLLKH